MALWSQAYTDAVKAVELAKPLLEHSSPEIRYVVTDLLVQMGLSTSQAALVPMLDDTDIRIALRAWGGVTAYGYDESGKTKDDLFERIEHLLERTPKNKTLKPIVWDWTERKTSLGGVARSLLSYLGERPISRLMPHAKLMDSYGRRQIVDLIDDTLKAKKTLPNDMHDALLNFVGDTSSDVRERAFGVLAKLEPSNEDVKRLEPLLSRKAGDLRRGVITLITNQKDTNALASAERLLSASKAPLREAGLEVLRELKTSERSLERVQTLTETHTARTSQSQTESSLLESLLASRAEEVTLENGLGLFDPAARSKPITPENKSKRLLKKGRVFKTDTAARLIMALDELVHTQRETPIQLIGYSDNREELLGNWQYGIWQPFKTVWQNGERVTSRNPDDIPLKDVWETWWQIRPNNLRDNDGFDALRAYASFLASQQHLGKGGVGAASKKLFSRLERSKLRYERTVFSILQWFFFKTISADTLDFVLDAAETSLALVPADAFEKWEAFQKEQEKEERWYRRSDLRESRLFSWFHVLGACRAYSHDWTNEHALRHWHLSKNAG